MVPGLSCCCTCIIKNGTVTIDETGLFVIPVADGSREVGLTISHNAGDGDTVTAIIFCDGDGNDGIELSNLVNLLITDGEACDNWTLTGAPGPWTGDSIAQAMTVGRMVDEDEVSSYRTNVGCVTPADDPPAGTHAAIRAPEGTVITYSFFRVTEACTLPGCNCDPYSPCGADVFGNILWGSALGSSSVYGWQQSEDTTPPNDGATYPSGTLFSASLVIPLNAFDTGYNLLPSASGIFWFRVETCCEITINVTATCDQDPVERPEALTYAVGNVFPVCVPNQTSFNGDLGTQTWSDGSTTGPAVITCPPGIYGAYFQGSRNGGFWDISGAATFTLSGDAIVLEACE
jgi:hypothetical protein